MLVIDVREDETESEAEARTMGHGEKAGDPVPGKPKPKKPRKPKATGDGPDGIDESGWERKMDRLPPKKASARKPKSYGTCSTCGGALPKDIRAHYCPAEAENRPAPVRPTTHLAANAIEALIAENARLKGRIGVLDDALDAVARLTRELADAEAQNATLHGDMRFFRGRTETLEAEVRHLKALLNIAKQIQQRDAEHKSDLESRLLERERLPRSEWHCNQCDIEIYRGEDRATLDTLMFAHARVCEGTTHGTPLRARR